LPVLEPVVEQNGAEGREEEEEEEREREKEKERGRERKRDREIERERERERERAWVRKSPRGQERRKCPLRPLSSFEVHERLRRTKRRRSGYSLPFLLSRGVLPFPLEARTGRESLRRPFTITIIVDDDIGRKKRRTGLARQREREREREREVGNKRVLSLLLSSSLFLKLASSNAGETPAPRF